MKNHFHIKGWALNLILIQRPRGSWKWPIVLPPPPKKIYLYSNHGYPGCQRLFMHSFHTQSSLYSEPCKKFLLATLQLVTSAFDRRICQPGADMQEKTSGIQGNHGGPIALISQPPPPPPPRPPNNTTITPLKIPHWVMLTLNNRELKQGHFWETRVDRKWGFFPWLCLQVLPNVYCYRAVVKCRGRGFPLATMNTAAATFIGKQKKNKTKRNP